MADMAEDDRAATAADAVVRRAGDLLGVAE